jgi:hypothetical protein
MKKLMTGLALSAVAALLVAPAPVARAQSEYENSTFTVTQPVDVGTFTLQPGTYLIKVVMLSSDRNLIQVTNTDQTRVFASVLATPHPIRPNEATPISQYVYYTAAPGQNQALRTWFPRDSANGQDIIYPKHRAIEIAAVAKAPVIAIPDDVKESDYKTTSFTVITPEQAATPYEAPPPVMVAEALPPNLPATASQVPIFVMLGLLFVGGAITVRMLGQKRPTA